LRFGYLVNALQENVLGIAPEDISRHLYILAASGSGKSTLIRGLYKHLECANHTDSIPNSTIYIDIKDDDAKLFVQQCEPTSFEKNNVVYLDINHMEFGFNLLELPEHSELDRELLVSRMVGHIIEMIREFYTQQQTFIQIERIMRLLLFYLYSNTDNPTIIDLYEIIIRLQRDGRTELERIFKTYKNVTGPEMRQSLDAISRLSKESWVPILNRVEMFATDEYLKKKFAVSHTTINFEKMLIPGNITIFRISDTETPKYAHGLAIMAIVLKIWFTIQSRASRTEQNKRSLVVLALDEFQRIKDSSIITAILSQARTYNLGLILSHQNLSQIDTSLLETVIGNTASQIYGRVSGIDANRIAKAIDPHFAKELTDQITAQPDFVFTARTRPASGQQYGLPVQFRALPPPPLILNETEITEFMQKMKKHYKNFRIIRSVLNVDEDKKTEWIKMLKAEYRTEIEWKIIVFLRDNSGNLKQIVDAIDSTDRNETRTMIETLKERDMIRIVNTTKIASKLVHEYTISEKARDMYFPTNFHSIGSAEDVDEISKKALEYYLAKGFFVSIATQIRKKGKPVCDMIAYDYQRDLPISIEIESRKHVYSHPEQVKFNMTKWKDLGFVECHVWSKSEKIEEIKRGLGNKADKVFTFIVKS